MYLCWFNLIFEMFLFSIEMAKLWWINRPSTKGRERSRKHHLSITFQIYKIKFFFRKNCDNCGSSCKICGWTDGDNCGSSCDNCGYLRQLWLVLRQLWLIATIMNIATIVISSTFKKEKKSLFAPCEIEVWIRIVIRWERFPKSRFSVPNLLPVCFL